jgi:hypothetical protein
MFSLYLDYYNSDNDIHRSLSDIQLYHKSPPCYRKNDKKKNEDDELETDEDVQEISGM